MVFYLFQDFWVRVRLAWVGVWVGGLIWEIGEFEGLSADLAAGRFSGFSCVQGADWSVMEASTRYSIGGVMMMRVSTSSPGGIQVLEPGAWRGPVVVRLR